MTFNEIVICNEEYQILSQLVNGGSIEYKLSSANAPYFCRLVKLELITSDYMTENGTLDITETPLQARITPLGENYFCYSRDQRKRDKTNQRFQVISLLISIAALIVSIIAIIATHW